MNTISRLCFLASLAALLIVATSCHTVHGAGQDLRQLGRGIERAVQ